MLTLVQASRIVRDCIRVAVGFTGPIEASDKLQDVGIVDLDAREALNDEIVTNREKGVQSEGHRLGADDLTFTIATKVFELRDEVFEKAVPGDAFLNALVGPGLFGGPENERSSRASNDRASATRKRSSAKAGRKVRSVK
ncbi:MAG: hypothetical protein QOF62_2421 [Pyrinomonadaceae bacterium]|nr:hypothetical protein [Pyrinomonadaceae bacterium]